ncbi:MAG: CBS domain-containing protein [Candidatus Hodarchaeota archaeon]
MEEILILPDFASLKYLRKSLNFSQKELGDKLGIPQSTISRIENGTMDPPYSKFKRIYEFLEIESRKKKQAKMTARDIMTDNIISIKPKSSIKEAIELMYDNDISQLPIIEKGQNVGSITSKKIQKEITDKPEIINADIFLIKELPFPEVEVDWDAKDISNLLVNYPAVLVKRRDSYIGIITDSDFLKLTTK